MQVYTIGFKSPDGAKAVELTHERMLTQSQLEAMVQDVLPDAARAHIAAQAEKERKRGQVPEELFETCFIPRLHFNHVYLHVVELLIQRHGFQRLQYTASVSVFSVPDLLVKGDAAGDPDGDDALQARLSDALAAAGLPVETIEQRDAHEEAKIEALTPIRRERRSQRAVERYQATGHNPFRTEDLLLAQSILSHLAGRPLGEGETAVLEEILPPVLEEGATPDSLGRLFLTRPELHELAVVLGAELPVAEAEPVAVAENKETAPEEAVSESQASEDADQAAIPQTAPSEAAQEVETEVVTP